MAFSTAVGWNRRPACAQAAYSKRPRAARFFSPGLTKPPPSANGCRLGGSTELARQARTRNAFYRPNAFADIAHLHADRGL